MEEIGSRHWRVGLITLMRGLLVGPQGPGHDLDFNIETLENPINVNCSTIGVSILPRSLIHGV